VQLLGDEPREIVGGASGRKRDHEANRLVRPALRGALARRHAGQHERAQRAEGQQLPDRRSHRAHSDLMPILRMRSPKSWSSCLSFLANAAGSRYAAKRLTFSSLCSTSGVLSTFASSVETFATISGGVPLGA